MNHIDQKMIVNLYYIYVYLLTARRSDQHHLPAQIELLPVYCLMVDRVKDVDDVAVRYYLTHFIKIQHFLFPACQILLSLYQAQ